MQRYSASFPRLFSFPKNLFPLLLCLFSALALLPGCTRGELTLATTTSLYDSGLLARLIPPFQKERGIRVEVVAVGSGQALALGERGDADVLLVHAPALEEEFMARGLGAERREVMYNHFILLGPKGDPAGVRGLASAPQALARIAKSQAGFVSRGDDSGTHHKEKEIWKKIALDPKGEGWYFSIGQGMGPTLLFASEKGAYTLSDRGTYLALKEKLDLVPLVQGGGGLLNPYSVIAVSPERHPPQRHKLALDFLGYLTSPQAQRVIADYGQDEYGEPLFFPAWGGGP